nr:ATP synthase F0 subunit 8 [Micropotamogale ruwenzorii]
MPQLDTSPWLMTILSMMLILFIILQIKLSKINFPHNLLSKHQKIKPPTNPWEDKWTKIYLPHLKPRQ